MVELATFPLTCGAIPARPPSRCFGLTIGMVEGALIGSTTNAEPAVPGLFGTMVRVTRSDLLNGDSGVNRNDTVLFALSSPVVEISNLPGLYWDVCLVGGRDREPGAVQKYNINEVFLLILRLRRLLSIRNGEQHSGHRSLDAI